jgi:hypothetical protein
MRKLRTQKGDSMKKSISFLLVAAMAASVPLFAEINLGFWSRAVWTPFAIQEEAAIDDAGKDVTGTTSSIGPGWDGLSNARIGVDLSGQNEGGNFGFQLGIKSILTDFLTGEKGAIGDAIGFNDVISINENAYVWINIFDILNLNVGKFNKDALRGGAYRANDWFDMAGLEYGFWEDVLFARFRQNGGVLLESTAVKNLYLGIALGVVGTGKYISNYEQDPTSPDGFRHDKDGDRIPVYTEYGPFYKNGFGDVFAQGRYAAAYTIPDITRIKLQFQGGKRATPVPGHGGLHVDGAGLTPYSWIQLGADVYAVPGVALEAGLTIPFEYKDKLADEKILPGVRFGFGAKATVINALTLAGSFGFQFGDKITPEPDDDNYNYDADMAGDYDPVTSGFTFTTNIEADYAITNILSAGIGFGLKTVGNTDGKKPGTYDPDDSGYVAANLGVNVGVKIGGNAYLGVGLAIKDLFHVTNGTDDPDDDDDDWLYKERKPVFAIPIGFSFSL